MSVSHVADPDTDTAEYPAPPVFIGPTLPDSIHVCVLCAATDDVFNVRRYGPFYGETLCGACAGQFVAVPRQRAPWANHLDKPHAELTPSERRWEAQYIEDHLDDLAFDKEAIDR